MTDISEALNLVAKHFGGDYGKTLTWFTEPNPLLGNVKPFKMVAIDGSCPKLLKFIKNQLAENIEATGGRES